MVCEFHVGLAGQDADIGELAEYADFTRETVFQELDKKNPQAVGMGPDRQADGGCGFAFAIAGIDVDQAGLRGFQMVGHLAGQGGHPGCFFDFLRRRVDRFAGHTHILSFQVSACCKSRPAGWLQELFRPARLRSGAASCRSTVEANLAGAVPDHPGAGAGRASRAVIELFTGAGSLAGAFVDIGLAGQFNRPIS